MTAREIEEYRALRDTIRERSTLRVWMVLVGLSAWAALTIATGTLADRPVSTLLPLLILAVTFEVVFGLHTAVERIGRYIQVFFESELTDRGWEHQAMAYGRQFPGGGLDPLFAAFFWAATLLNVAPAVVGRPAPIEWVVVGTAHLLVITRIALARRQARQQRPLDLDRFQRLKQGTPT
jgi:hypothetical protein